MLVDPRGLAVRTLGVLGFRGWGGSLIEELQCQYSGINCRSFT